jgi:hypothetical protein
MLVVALTTPGATVTVPPMQVLIAALVVFVAVGMFYRLVS